MQRLALLPLMTALAGLPSTVQAFDIGPNLKLDGEVRLEFRGSAGYLMKGVAAKTHLRWTSAGGGVGVDLGADVFRNGSGLNFDDLTYASVMVNFDAGSLYLGQPKTAVETLVALPEFSGSSLDNFITHIYSRSAFRQLDTQTDSRVYGATWLQKTGNLEVATSIHNWRSTETAGVMHVAQLALRYEQGGTRLMAGGEYSWGDVALVGSPAIYAYHLAAQQELGRWQLGAMVNSFTDDFSGTTRLLQLQADYDLTPQWNVGLHYAQLGGFLETEAVSLNTRYTAASQPLFVEASAGWNNFNERMLALGVGISF